MQKQRGVARAMLLRILQIALLLSFFLMAGLYLGRSAVPRIFTEDPAVIAIAERVFPILAVFMVSALLSDCFLPLSVAMESAHFRQDLSF